MTECVFSQFWRLEVQDKDRQVWLSPKPRCLACRQLTSLCFLKGLSSLCTHHQCFFIGPNFLFLKRYQLYWNRAHSEVLVAVMSNSLQPQGLQPTSLLCPQDSPGRNTGGGTHSFLQGTFPTQESNLCFPHCGQILAHPNSLILIASLKAISPNTVTF